MAKNHMKTLIIGPGRAGTSFLMRVLTRLGFDTGFTRDNDGYDEAGGNMTNMIRAMMEIMKPETMKNAWRRFIKR